MDNSNWNGIKVGGFTKSEYEYEKEILELNKTIEYYKERVSVMQNWIPQEDIELKLEWYKPHIPSGKDPIRGATASVIIPIKQPSDMFYPINTHTILKDKTIYFDSNTDDEKPNKWWEFWKRIKL